MLSSTEAELKKSLAYKKGSSIKLWEVFIFSTVFIRAIPQVRHLRRGKKKTKKATKRHRKDSVPSKK